MTYPDQSRRDARVDAAIERARRFFAEAQNADGHWRGELEGDVLTLSETVLLLAFLGEERSPLALDCAKSLLATQLPSGGWEAYPGAGPDVVNVVKGYFALKLTGEDPESEPMRRARNVALELGGADAVNSFTRFYLAILGQIPFDKTPAIPPQAVLVPTCCPINLYSISSWSRQIFVPLSIVSALRPVRNLPPELGIRELFVEEPKRWKPLVCPGKKRSRNPLSWEALFRRGDRAVWLCRRLGITPLRKKAIAKALRWTLERFERGEGPGSIYPPIVWSWVAFKALGFADDSPEVRECRRRLEELVVRDPETGLVRVQPCRSPVWDTTLTVKSLLATGLSEETPFVRKALDWIRARQIDIPGDWSNNVAVRPGGWAFEYKNDLYPDNDDTAMALTALGGAFPENGARPTAKSLDADEALRRGVDWLFATQNKDGGWGAFDKDNTNELLCKVPFADHNAMIDPSCPDLSGRVLEALGRLGFRLDAETSNSAANRSDSSGRANAGSNAGLDAGLDAESDANRPNAAWSRKRAARIWKAVAYMKREQRPDGSWFGRWGTNYIYGTWQAISGLRALGVPTSDPAIRAGANWLLAKRQADSGAWGESQDSYRDPKLAGLGAPTCSQTAWAVMGLIAAGLVDSDAVRSGIDYLLAQQRDEGSWREVPFTGTGFPLVYYLKYRYYPIYFSTTALGFYRAARTSGGPETSESESNAGTETVGKPRNVEPNRSNNAPSQAVERLFADASRPRLKIFVPPTPERRTFDAPETSERTPDAAPTILRFVPRSRFDDARSRSQRRLEPESKPVERAERLVLRLFDPNAETARPRLRVFTG